MNDDTPNRHRPASQLTKREHAALELYARNTDMSVGAAVRAADSLFDELEVRTELPELRHPFEMPDFEYEGAS